MRAIFGEDTLENGEIYIEGEKIKIKSPQDAIAAGIGLCPEDRKDQGLVLNRSIKDNITISNYTEVAKKGVINRKKETAISQKAVKKYNIKTPSIHKAVIELSGGNQQKVILGRWMSSNLKVLILDEPTKGIDVGAKSEIYQMVCDLAKSGLGVIFISSELPEILNVCDNIIVMYNGRVNGSLCRAEVSDEKVLALAMNV